MVFIIDILMHSRHDASLLSGNETLNTLSAFLYKWNLTGCPSLTLFSDHTSPRRRKRAWGEPAS